MESINQYYETPCGCCNSYFGHHKDCGYWSLSGIAEKIMFESVNQRYKGELFKLQNQVHRMRELCTKLIDNNEKLMETCMFNPTPYENAVELQKDELYQEIKNEHKGTN